MALKYVNRSVPLTLKSLYAGQSREVKTVPRASVSAERIGPRVAYSEDNRLGDASLRNWKAKHRALLPSSKSAALKTPPVMSAKSRPVKVFTPFVLPPMLVKISNGEYKRFWDSLPEQLRVLDDGVVYQVLGPIHEQEELWASVIILGDPVTSLRIHHVVVWTTDTVYTLQSFLACCESC